MKDEPGGTEEPTAEELAAAQEAAPIEDITYHTKGQFDITCFTDHITGKKRYVSSDVFTRKMIDRTNLAEPLIQRVPFNFQIKASSLVQAFKRRESAARKALEEFKRQSLNPGPPPDEEPVEDKPHLEIVKG